MRLDGLNMKILEGKCTWKCKIGRWNKYGIYAKQFPVCMR